ncbi:MAG: DUF4296 domain-containing protein [Porphyromonas sp.]|nr:DUF4296 domain-containing protein [Porphyromonas sp.]
MRGVVKRVVLWTTALSLLVGCSSREWTLIGEEDVRRLLPRYALLNAALQNRGEQDSIRQAAYRAFFEEEGYTLADWDSSMLWYAKNDITLYHDFYRLAADSMARSTERVQLRVDSITAAEERMRKLNGAVLDSTNLLSLGLETYRAGEYLNRYFMLTPSTPYTAVRGELGVGIWGLPKLKKDEALSLELRFHAKDSTTRIERLSIAKSGFYSVRLVTMEGKDVVRVSGALRGTLPKKLQRGYVLVDSLRFVRTPHDNIPNPKQDSVKSIAAPPAESLPEASSVLEVESL